MGAVTLPVGWRLAPAEIGYILEDSNARLVFAGPEVRHNVIEAISGLKTQPGVIDMEGIGSSCFNAWRSSHSTIDPHTEIERTDVAIQLYTSGTTGNPTGVMLTHDNLLAGRREAVLAELPWNQWGPDDVCLIAMPVGHIGGSGWGMLSLLNGARGVIAREFDPYSVLGFIQNEKISKLFMVPSALQIAVRQPGVREVDFSSLRYILYGASPIPLQLLKECMDVFGCGFCQQYGMTETCGTIVYLPPEDHDPAGNERMRSAGIPMPGVELKIVDAEGASLPPNSIGEIVTRSKANMKGYWNLADATAKALDADGWLKTGDAGYLDEDGYLFIKDRVKDMIISGGENVYPAEVENAMHGHPAVGEVAVIGVPDDVWGEAVKAIVVPKPGAIVDEQDIVRFTKARIASFKAPKSVDFVDALPRNATGKVLKTELRQRYWSHKDSQVN